MDQIGQNLPGGTAALARGTGEPEASGPDKWEVLADLVTAAPGLGLRPATLSVLRALLTFLPTRALPHGPAAIVFPSNRTLSARLEGMPEATLRRHLARLVEAGLILRRDSPNGKRFARRTGGRIAAAFGFDTGPLRAWSPRIAELASEAREESERCAMLRDEIRSLRDRLNDATEDEGVAAELQEVRRALKRRPDIEALTALHRRLIDLDRLRTATGEPPRPAGMIAAAARNERHHQRTDPYDSLAERSPARCAKANPVPVLRLPRALQDALEEMVPGASRSWRETEVAAHRLAPLIGVEPRLWQSALRDMGSTRAVTALLCILRRGTAIRSPGAYMRTIATAARAGRLRMDRLLASACPVLSADNRHIEATRLVS